jgi:hypothetical protein
MKNQADRISSDFLAVGVSVRPYGCQSPQFSVLENLNSGADDFCFPGCPRNVAFNKRRYFFSELTARESPAAKIISKVSDKQDP